MGQFPQRVDLVHKLGQLGRTEKFADNGLHRLGVDQRAGRKRGQLAVHAVTRRFCHLGKPHADLVFQQFPNPADTAVAQVVNIVYLKDHIVAIHFLRIFAGVQGQQILYGHHNIFRRQRAAFIGRSGKLFEFVFAD